MGFGKILGAAATGGISLLGKDKLLGKKDMGVGDRFLNLDPDLAKLVKEGRKQQLALTKDLGEEVGAIKSVNTGDLASRITAKKELGIRAAAEDAARKAKEAVAQRGLGRSAIGMRAQTNPFQQMGEKIGQIRADEDLTKLDVAQKKIGAMGGASGAIARAISQSGPQRAFIKGREGRGRSGGLLGIGLGAAGAAFSAKSGGNPMQGFGAGQGMGQAFANL